MSRIGKQNIKIPDKTEVSIDGGKVSVKGPLGEISRDFGGRIGIQKNNEGEVVFSLNRNDRETTKLWGTYAREVANMLNGVNKGFEKKLIVEGIGYKSEVKGSGIVMSLGFSHPVSLEIPKGLKVTADKNIITVSGIDKDLVSQFVAKIRAQKKQEPYKGKGIRYSDESIRRKQGKKTA